MNETLTALNNFLNSPMPLPIGVAMFTVIPAMIITLYVKIVYK